MQETPEGFGVDVLDGQTTVHPLGLVALLLCAITMVIVPRKYAIWPLFAVVCCIAPGQRFAIASFNFNFIRIMVIFGLARVALRGENLGLRVVTMDWIVVAHAIVGALVYTAQYGDFAAFANRGGLSFDALGMYFLFRCLMRSWDDVHSMILGIIYISIPVTVAFLIERATGRNVFAFLGGVPEITGIREGVLRCQGAFQHPIIAGCFWAAVLPLVAARWFTPGKDKLLTFVGVGCCLSLIVLSASSTPLMGVAFALIAAVIYPFRRHMLLIKMAAVAGLLILHFAVLDGPVWSLLAKVNILGGSTGWHRYYLFDQAINRFPEWCWLGTRDTSHWGWGLWDITNHFVLEGARGGFATLVLFITIYGLTFKYVGVLLRSEGAQKNRASSVMAWALGTFAFVNVCSFFAISYTGQMTILIWLSAGVSATLISTERRLVRSTSDNRALDFNAAQLYRKPLSPRAF